MLTSAFRAGGSRAILAAWSLAPRRSWAAPASSGRSSARSPPRGRAAARPSSWPARRASARPGSPPSSPAAPATAASQTLLGRSIDLVGTELPYQPFAEALRPIGGPRPAASSAGSQLRVFEETLALLTDHAAAAPVLLVLEDLHWADTSTLDLVVFLAHNLAERPVVLLATYRRDEPSSKGRMARLADGVRRSGSGLVLDLGPLPPEDLTALLAARAGRARSPRRWPTRSSPAPQATPSSPRSSSPPAEPDRRAPAPRARPAAAAGGTARRRGPGPAAAGRRRRARRRLPAAPRARRGPRARRARGRCARPSSTRSSSPTRPRAPSGSATRCWPKPSTRRSSPASARSCTPASPGNCRAPRPPRRPSSRRTGRRRAAPPRR